MTPAVSVCYSESDMDLLTVVILGILEGITEFVPVSSTGHLVLAERLLGLEPTTFLLSFSIAIQLGAILAVAFLYWKTLTSSWDLIWHLAVALVPAIVAGLVLYPFVKQLLTRPDVVLWALAIGGAVMIGLERWILPKRRPISDDPVRMTYRTAALIGVFQALALIPGVSRSAATIIGGLVAGMSRSAAVQFSFLLALPTMAAATGFDMYQNYRLFTSEQFGMIFLGAAVACVTAVFAMRWLLRYLRNHDLTAFGAYRIILAGAFWLLIL